MGLATLGLNLTGDLLPWDQNSFWATSIRVAYLSHLPGIGPWLCKLAIGGPQFGTLTITRFLALHVGVCTAALLALIFSMLTWPCAPRPGSGSQLRPEERVTPVPYWPQQAWRDAAACFVVLAVVVGLSASHGVSGPQAGIELGAPANRSMIPARPGPSGRSAASTSFTKRSADGRKWSRSSSSRG